jgi:glycosyltransferase involved in cell wall biosynthesis
MTKLKRALWLINHTTLRRFEVPILQSLGYEVFLPKIFPYDEGNLSASVDHSFDSQLSIPAADLEILNRHNFYTGISTEVRAIINAHFEIAFFSFFPEQLAALVREFKGRLVMRPFGLAGTTYTELTAKALGRFFLKKIERIEHRFWFGQAYAHLSEVESGVYRRKAVTLPLGLEDASPRNAWKGSDARILFVCPRIGTSAYFKEVYDQFKRDFGDYPHLIGGAQPIPVFDPNLAGFLPRAAYDDMMCNMRVMFYHSREERHLHYHPLEAIRLGMPLIFMAGGMLDRFGAIGLPGRCNTIKEARQKLQRVLSGDRELISNIKQSQARLLEPMKSETCEVAWRAGLERITGGPKLAWPELPRARTPKRRIAVIVPIKYRGGSLRGAKLLARAIATGSRMDGDDIEVVFGHLDDPACYPKEAFEDLPVSIKRRPYRWRIVPHDEAVRACAYAGLSGSLKDQTYQAPDDGISQFTDCDLWIVISDRLDSPLLPVRPYLLMVYDYLQRYQTLFDDDSNQKFVARAHAAEAVMVTTAFTAGDARQFAGIPAKKIKRVPMLAPESLANENPARLKDDTDRFFLWTTNLASHKNHENAFKALRLYYEKYEGSLKCHVTGVDTRELFKRDASHLRALRDIRQSSAALKHHLKIEGELPDQSYQAQLGCAAFLWHPGRIDNGTFSVVEAAHLGVPALSSDYPAMREIDQQFSLHLTWMDPDDPNNMARQLKRLETDWEALRHRLPSAEQLAGQSVDRLAGAYWSLIKDYL